MGKSFERAVLKLRPDWRVVNRYFYMLPADRILCGFVYEKGSGGAYIWHYANPLYDRVDELTLKFADRLPHPQGFIERKSRSPTEEAAEFLRRVDPWEAAMSALRDPGTLRAAMEHSEAMESVWVRRAYAMTCIVLGRASEAEWHLRALGANAAFDRYPRFREDIERISNDLVVGIGRAQQTLFEWETETKARFGIEA